MPLTSHPGWKPASHLSRQHGNTKWNHYPFFVTACDECKRIAKELMSSDGMRYRIDFCKMGSRDYRRLCKRLLNKWKSSSSIVIHLRLSRLFYSEILFQIRSQLIGIIWPPPHRTEFLLRVCIQSPSILSAFNSKLDLRSLQIRRYFFNCPIEMCSRSFFFPTNVIKNGSLCHTFQSVGSQHV